MRYKTIAAFFSAGAILLILPATGSELHGIVYSGIQNHVVDHRSDDLVSISMADAPDLFFIEDVRGGFVLNGITQGSYSSVFDTNAPGWPVIGYVEGVSIRPDADWTSLAPARILRYEDPAFGSGDFFDQTDRYMALRISRDDDTYFGWLRLSHSMADERLTLHDWAWNSSPGDPILAGEIPEPRTYALLAGLAGLGAVLWRRLRAS